MKKELTSKEKWKISFIKSVKYSFILFIVLFVLNLIGDLFPFYNPRFLGSLLISLGMSIVLFFPILISEKILQSKNQKWHKSIFLILPLMSYFEVIIFSIIFRLSIIDSMNKKFSLSYFFPIGSSIFLFAITTLLLAFIISLILYKKNKKWT